MTDKKQFIHLFIYILFLFLAIPAKAQNVTFFSSKQGLSNTCIRSLYEDSRHNIWITTQNGLNRYDGVKMNVYRHDDNDSTSLKHAESTFVLEYDKDHMLVGTGNGTQLYDYKTDKFTNVYFHNTDGTIQPLMRSFHADRLRSGKIIVCNAGFGCAELMKDEEGKLYLQHTEDYNTENVSPIQIFEDEKNNIWIVNSNGSILRWTAKGKYKKYEQIQHVQNVCSSSTGKVYVATLYDGVYCYDATNDSFIHISTPFECGIISSINRWVDGEIIICTDGGGMRIYNEKSKSITQSTLQINDFNLAASNVKHAIIDSYGNLWIGIYWKGVIMRPNNKSAFEYIGRHSFTKNTLGTNSVVSMAPAKDGNIMVGTDNCGLYILSADGTRSTHYKPDEHPGMPRTFTSIAALPSGGFLLGSFFDGLYKFENGQVTLLNKDIHFIFDIKPGSDGGYWIASMRNRYYYYYPSTNTFYHYNETEDSKQKVDNRLSNNYVGSILQVGKKVFIGTQDGLNIADVETGGRIKNNKRVLAANTIRHVAVLNGKAWVATDRGLFCVDIKTLDTKRYTIHDGLPINSLRSIMANDGKLWIGTDNGLSCFNPKTETFNNFFDADGLQDNEFDARAALEYNGKLYFGGISGMTYFNPKEIDKGKKHNHQLHLRFVDLLLSNNTIHVGDKSGSYDIITNIVDESEEINLSSNDNHFTLHLCVDGVFNQHISYEYSIDGSGWITEEQSVSRLVFSNLSTGTHKIVVRAKGFNLTSEERMLKVVVHAPWYASPLAKIIYLILLLTLCWLAYQYAQRQVKARKVILRHRQEREIAEARIQFFMNISHEIRTPMTLILAPLEKLISSDNDPERQRNYKLMKQNSNRILRLINQMMDVRKIEQGKFQLDYRQVELVSLLKNIYDVFITNAQNRNISYEFLNNDNQLTVYVDPENVDKIVMNLLSNAFKFTPDGGRIVLELQSNKNSNSFSIKVCDSGCGISDEDKTKIFDRFYSASHKNGYIGTGIGLNLTYMLVNLHKGDIMVENNPHGAGTQFVVNIPVGNKSLVSYSPEAEDVTTNTTTKDSIDAQSVPSLEMEVEKPTDSHNRHIILVEDDENIRQYVHTELSSNFIVHECTNGQEAWDFVLKNPQKVNLIISDIMMPVMDGMTLCQKVKSNFNTNHIPIILMTALGSDADRIAGITNGADAYVSKPFNIDVLRSTAKNLMKTRLMLQGKFNGEKLQEEKIEKVDIESPDEHLMRRVMKCINENMSNPDLSVEMIADKVGISRVHFYRKMKDLTGQSPRDYLKYVRLKEAARLLEEKSDLDITSVSIAVGFKSLSSFSTNFKQLFGKTPSEWAKKE